ncbi:10143_t:CDS:2 [Diversispora eburnea]|uniref:10143_t:CDS:1 n=1 Tax=Diversispora eburnea TaxID=1213867 RepID=A0A9N8YKB8_9GLOM|nr:10143_t:CDS:2 [Diversispora eburnea]
MASKFVFEIILFYLMAKVSKPPNKIKSTPQDVYKREGIIGMVMYFLRVAGVFQLSLYMIYGFYVYLIYQQEYSGKSEYTNNDLPILSEWDNTFIIVSIMKIIGMALRLWCYKTLGEFFTLDLTIQKDHKLITHASQFAPFVKLYESSLSPMIYSIFSFLLLMCHPSSTAFKFLTTLDGD